MRKISAEDPRFGSLVRALGSKAADLRAVFAENAQLRNGLNTHKILPIAGNISEVVVAAQKLSLSREILSVLNARTNNTGVILRLGLDGGEPMTLQQAGEVIGVTRERVRQKQQKLEQSILKSKPFTPILDKALATLTQVIGANVMQVADVEKRLREEGVLSNDETVKQILRFARLKGRQGYQIAGSFIGKPEALVQFESLTDTQVRKLLDKMTKEFGAVAFDGLRDALLQTSSADLVDQQLPLALAALGEEIEWLEADSWLRLRRNWNRLRNFAAKILAVAPSIRIGDLRKGLQRHHRIAYVPPTRILGKMLESDLADFKVSFDGKIVSAANPPQPESQLSSVDLMVYQVLKSNGGVMARIDLETELRAKGMVKGTFHVAIGYSPVFDRIVKGVYAIRGAPLEPSIVDSLASKTVVRTRLDRDYGHLPDGRIYLAQEMSKFAVEQAMFGRPAGLRGYLADRSYAIHVEGDSTPYEVRCSSDQIRFSGHALSTYGVEAGDFALLVFDLTKSTVELSVGDESVVEKLRAPKDGIEVS
jgi:hypothetical protein